MKTSFLSFLVISLVGCKCDYIFQTQYAEVPVDHFSYTNNHTFKVKYLINDSYWSDDGPIFFYTGNEGSIELFAQNSGFIMELAPKFNALVVFCEHRYYGTSLPYGNLSYTKPEYLGFLSSEQALHDFVDVIDVLQQSKYGTNGPLPVIAFGGSYGGMLSTWIRLKYPASVLGAIAASAPIWQFTDLTPCGIFNTIVTNVYSSSAKDYICSDAIRKFWPALRKVTKTPDGKAWLSSDWKLCKNITKDDDVQSFVDDISNALVNLAMANYPYPSTFLGDLPAYPVNALCERLEGFQNYTKDDKGYISFIGKAVNIYTNYSGKAKCNDFGDVDGLSTNGWDYQTCTEMVMPMCSEQEDMFETSPWDFKKFSADCVKKWGVKPRNPKEVILQYGGQNLKYASNIVFSNGLLDPWSGGGVLSNISRTVSAIIIPEGAHHLDLRSSNSADPYSVKRARKFHADSITHWLRRYHYEKVDGEVLRV
ncbi:lysosomal Pro-X carboxypeptidase [Coccinella septempunctata]|uniref:lysosomal Pro-X carboxypeptidase n=1 Tax=Coccinella septempunctata TaxID=41139 RepID=UPI001D07141C|nr:lysosomal Pro-X carboxypeptidase [Coccinella septempunctata]